MKLFNFKTATFLFNFFLVWADFKAFGSIDVGAMVRGEGVNIKDVCKLSVVRFPDRNHKIGNILKTYALCLKEIDENYSGKDREKLTQALENRLECLQEDLKQAYYAGNVKYDDVQSVENFMENLHLKSGNSIVQESNQQRIRCRSRLTRSTVTRVVPLVITGTLSEKQKACEAIFKRENEKTNVTRGEIPTPKLDDNKDPQELTVPLSNPSTYKVDSPDAVNALTQYYKVVMKCLTLTTKHQIQVFRFNKKFYEWLTTAVLPHLKDDKCYPAFGGVLRIVQTMRENEYVPKNSTTDFIFYRQKNLEKQGEEIRRKEKISDEKKLPRFVIIWIIWPLILFLFILLCYQCFLCKTRLKDTSDSDSSYTEVFYYPIEGTPSVSIGLDSDGSFENYDPQVNHYRQRGGKDGKDDEQVIRLLCEEERTLIGVPLKRQCSSQEGSASMKSPGKRQRK